MSETIEILQAVDRLHAVLADLIVRGLRSVGPAQTAPLQSLREEFERVGASHLSGRIAALLDAVAREDRTAAAALLRTQTSLRLFERILTLERAADLLGTIPSAVSSPLAPLGRGVGGEGPSVCTEEDKHPLTPNPSPQPARGGHEKPLT